VHEPLVERDARLRQRGAVAGLAQARRAQVRTAGDEADPPVPELDEVPRRLQRAMIAPSIRVPLRRLSERRSQPSPSPWCEPL
jgi:hypothetical protein